MAWPWFGAFAALILFGFLLGILVLAFWFLMLVDCLKRKKFEDKLVWILVLLFLNVLGAILYYLLVKSKD